MSSKLRRLAESILINVPDSNSVAILSNDGLPIVSVTAENYDDDIIMTVTSAFQHLSSTILDELKFKNLNELIIRSDEGVILLMYIRSMDALLYISAYNSVKLGILILEAQRAVDIIMKEFN